MSRTLAQFCFVLWFGATAGFGQGKALEVAKVLEEQGRFKDAAELLTQEAQAPGITGARRVSIEFELDRLQRIKKDYPLTRTDLFEKLSKNLDHLAREEFDHWLREGRFDSREIDSQQFFMVTSVPNLFYRYPKLEPRRIPSKDHASVEKHHFETCIAIKRAALAAGKPYVQPKRFQATMSVTAEEGVAPVGALLRAWLPIPRDYPFQGDFQLLKSVPAIKLLDDRQSPVRSAYLESRVEKGKATEFEIDYEFTTHGVWFNVQPGNVRPSNLNDPSLRPYLKEAPHIVFSPQMRALSESIVGHEKNPYLKAKRVYDWIADHIQYSLAVEYSTIRNIGEYCRSHGYGDCGQQALLFMTLCRLNDIPARWQSGWNTFPGDESIHDWTEIYVAPYGWIPVDPYMGVYATRYANTLNADQRRVLRDFYFGGLDQYRMIANSDHCQTLNPPKRSFRSDTVDFQRGELEWGSHNIYFDKFSYDFSFKEIKPSHGGLD